MSSHARRKLRRKREIERRTLGKMFYEEDQHLFYSFIVVLRELMDVPTTAVYSYWFTSKPRRGC